LSQVEKQVSIGRLAAGVAHEINNPMTSVLSLSMLLEKDMVPGDPRKEDLEIIVQETTRCRDIVRQLLDFARERPSQKRVVDIHHVVDETLALVRKYERVRHVDISHTASDEPALVSVDAKQLQQVLTNIITNAAEAVDVDLARAAAPRGRVAVTVDEDASGAYVVVRVQDNGRGIAPEDQARIFEPFYTTKGEQRGTGLGLSVSLGIIRKHEGTIEIDSEAGHGTVVSVVLPRADGADDDEQSASDAGDAPGGTTA
jgi:two-component system, NtrC family, sensor kinase